MINNITENLKKAFCKLCSIPINIYSEPYFSERIELFDDVYESKRKWGTFLKDLEKFDTEVDFFDEKDNVFDAIVYHIKSSEGYKHFNESFQKPINDIQKSKKDIFRKENDQRKFISIDMRKANFSSLNIFNSEIFDNKKSWEEFIEQFTDIETLINSKYFRQIILGNCNAKRQISYEEYIMSKVLKLVTDKSIDENKLVFFSHDEIIFDVTDSPDAKLQFLQLAEFFNNNGVDLFIDGKISRKVIVPLKVEFFELHKINSFKGYYKKNLITNKVSFKCVEPNMYPIVLRLLKNEEIQENDKVFVIDDTLAKYIGIEKNKL